MKFALIVPLVFVLATAVPLAGGPCRGYSNQVPGVVVAPGPEHRDRDRCEALDSQKNTNFARAWNTPPMVKSVNGRNTS